MLKYEFKDRSANYGLTLAEEDGLRAVLYDTGYQEFNVTQVTISSGQAVYMTRFESVAIAIVLEGSALGRFVVNGSEQSLEMKNNTAYYLMPEQEVSISAPSGQPASVFICHCLFK